LAVPESPAMLQPLPTTTLSRPPTCGMAVSSPMTASQPQFLVQRRLGLRPVNRVVGAERLDWPGVDDGDPGTKLAQAALQRARVGQILPGQPLEVVITQARTGHQDGRGRHR
jgi:hypothetical protein